VVEDGKRIDGRKTPEPAKSIRVLDEMILIEAFLYSSVDEI